MKVNTQVQIAGCGAATAALAAMGVPLWNWGKNAGNAQCERQPTGQMCIPYQETIALLVWLAAAAVVLWKVMTFLELRPAFTLAAAGTYLTWVAMTEAARWGSNPLHPQWWSFALAAAAGIIAAWGGVERLRPVSGYGVAGAVMACPMVFGVFPPDWRSHSVPDPVRVAMKTLLPS
ncbi:hypothetical protein MUU72_04920 [Streptomyces sp. RS10V-4]|uniref:hypothetical protein n=1 Tax=Streptomyces rhizoryzae TaxID=2932493 RepID=UPI0020044DAC|nr:hypothetical protein [Streptomyces rhizoryzae]MCK7622458.1 hypothetical protein [Streptomyces rhizoryzae]